VRKWTKSACLVIAWSILPILAVAGLRGPSRAAQANTSIASSTKATLTDAPGTLSSAAADPAATPAVTWTVRPGDTLSAIASAFDVPGGWQVLYAANLRVVGSDPDVIRVGTVLTLPGPDKQVSYTIAPGDTLSGIATALAVPGGWQALYAANRHALGPDPDALRPGTTVVLPPRPAPEKPAARGTPVPDSHPARPPAAAGGHRVSPSQTVPAGGTVTPGATVTPGGTVSAGGRSSAGVMPRWLKVTLLAAALLTMIAFIAEPAAAAVRRRRRGVGASEPRAPGDKRAQRADGLRDHGPHNHGPHDDGQCAADNAARIVQADHERLIVTYSVQDDTVYLLTPPGEDPRAVLRAARLVLPEDSYEELAGHLGVPSGWPLQ
jgi:LysM repeat protein